MDISRKNMIIAAAAVILLAAVFWLWPRHPEAPSAKPAAPLAPTQTVTLTDRQLLSVKVAPVAMHAFVERTESVGYIDFNQDASTQVTPPYAGRITSIAVSAGQDVQRGQALFRIESPDLLQAESSLITDAGLLALTSSVLERAQSLIKDQGIPQKELDQAVSDHQTAEANYRSARDLVRVFGKSDAQMDEMIKSKKTDAEMVILAPRAGRVTSRNAAVGMLVQPGMAPPPLVVTDLQTMWLQAEVAELDLPAIHLGQKVKVQVDALPKQTFEATVDNIAEAVDPNTRRTLVRSQIKDPTHQLHPQMFAHFTIQTGQPTPSPAVPVSGVVREGDGTMIVFVTTDQKTFTRRPVQVGLIQDDVEQIRSGLQVGETTATEGALFLSNALATADQ